MASLLRSLLHGSHQVRLTQQVDVASSEIRSDTLRPRKLDQIADVINGAILLACSVDRSMRHKLLEYISSKSPAYLQLPHPKFARIRAR